MSSLRELRYQKGDCISNTTQNEHKSNKFKQTHDTMRQTNNKIKNTNKYL